MLETSVVDAPALDGGNEVWIEALPARIYQTPQYGPVPVTREKLLRMVDNFNKKVRGQDIATNFDHGADRAKGNQASGWFKEFAVKPSSDDPTQMSLYALVDCTDEAAQEIRDKKWRYFSLEWDDEWMDNSGQVWQDVVIGGAFTNKPIAKNIMPINFSESLWESLDYDTKKMFAVWSTKFVNDLPDSAFLHIQSGGHKDSEGKTTPRSLRHFPYKDSSGKIDLPHLRNAIARIPQAGSWLSDAMKSSLQARARKMLAGMSKAMAEGVLEQYEALIDAGLDVDISDESKEWEHSEPGTGSPPKPREDEDGSDDLAIREGWRREEIPDPIPPQDNANTNVTEGGGLLTAEQEAELRKILGIEGDGDILEGAKLQLGELTELKRNVDAATQERKFAEDYPAFWGEHSKLMARDRENTAKQFSESISRVRKAEGFGLKETAKGLSSMALSKVKDLHVHFAEGTATLEEFEDCIRTITNGGIVEFGEIGSSAADDVPLVDTSSAVGIANARRVFAEVVSKIQTENPDKDYKWAMSEAAKKHPDLAEAYAVALPG